MRGRSLGSLWKGKTNSIVERMSQHKANPEKDIFTNAHFIYYDKSNQSATFDYESRLIRFMVAENGPKYGL